MKKTSKKGFTIVELVIVIAVIAILAAVLIPTFSSLIQKAKLNADTQAVREMNLALKTDEKLHGKPKDIETTMRVLANAGYNSKNWVCLSVSYQVYWDKDENQCVLYNSKTAKIEYPSGYSASDFTTFGAGDRFIIYNNNYYEALKDPLQLTGGGDVGSSGLVLNGGTVDLSKLNLAADAAKTLELVNKSVTGSNAEQIKNTLGITGTESKVLSSTTETNQSSLASGTYASLGKTLITSDKDQVLESDSVAVKPNLFTISVTTKAGAAESQIKAARQEAASYVYKIFTQINSTTNVDNNVAIVIDAGTVLDLSANQWRAVDNFAGYFGTPDAANPIIIDGMELTDATGYAQTRAMAGSDSKYFMTGFIGTLYSEVTKDPTTNELKVQPSTVENLTFRNVTIKSPGKDFVVGSTNEGANNRNTVGIIGGIVPLTGYGLLDVTVRNIKVESTCSIIGESTVGGIVGYIGADNNAKKETAYAHGKVLIEGCEVHCPITSLDSISSLGYAPVGGILGFTCRANLQPVGGIKTADQTTLVQIKNCKVTSAISGYHHMGGIVGEQNTGAIYIENCDASSASFTVRGAQAGTDNRGVTVTRRGSLIGNVTGGTSAWATVLGFSEVGYYNCLLAEGYPVCGMAEECMVNGKNINAGYIKRPQLLTSALTFTD